MINDDDAVLIDNNLCQARVRNKSKYLRFLVPLS